MLPCRLFLRGVGEMWEWLQEQNQSNQWHKAYSSLSKGNVCSSLEMWPVTHRTHTRTTVPLCVPLTLEHRNQAVSLGAWAVAVSHSMCDRPTSGLLSPASCSIGNPCGHVTTKELLLLLLLCFELNGQQHSYNPAGHLFPIWLTFIPYKVH